ncbi:hypothetical protein ACIGBL_34785 [Streptomyces sp. NPDC085614]|uniref:hypothetical protein n=1 Tax=Streptomyces sp. NPDC085614 TaxID=3365733 RepID=UPI0037D42DBD
MWLDDVACRFAGTDHDADELFARAWQFVDELGLEPGGFLTREDPALFTTLRGSAASMLARLWVTGYLLGPVPEDAWPAEELAVLLLRAWSIMRMPVPWPRLSTFTAASSEGPGSG